MKQELSMLETERLQHRPFLLEDLDRLVAIRANEQAAQYIGGLVGNTKAQLQKRIEHYKTTHDQYGFGAEAIVWKATQEIIGWSGLQPIEDSEQIQLTYGVAPAFWRQGIGYETAIAWLDYGFNHLQLEQIWAITAPNNTGSWKIMEKLGMYPLGLQPYKDILCRVYAISKAGFSNNGASGLKYL